MNDSSLVPFNSQYVLTPFGLHNNSIISFVNNK